MKTYICSLVVTILVSSACDRATTSPTSPAPPPPSPASSPAVFTVSGTVTEMTPSGPAPLKGALVQDHSGQATLTDDGGSYTLALVAGNHFVTTSKAGYTPLGTGVVLSADVRLDLQLRRVPTLSGVVFEVTASGRVPVEGVQVYCDACFHDFQSTDANGQYLFESASNGALALLVDKPGYVLAGSQPGPRSDLIIATVEGNTRFDIELVRR